MDVDRVFLGGDSDHPWRGIEGTAPSVALVAIFLIIIAKIELQV